MLRSTDCRVPFTAVGLLNPVGNPGREPGSQESEKGDEDIEGHDPDWHLKVQKEGRKMPIDRQSHLMALLTEALGLSDESVSGIS